VHRHSADIAARHSAIGLPAAATVTAAAAAAACKCHYACGSVGGKFAASPTSTRLSIYCCLESSHGDGAEKEQRAFDISVGVLRVLPARRRRHLLGHRGTDRAEETATAAGRTRKVPAEQARLSERSVSCSSLSYHMAH